MKETIDDQMINSICLRFDQDKRIRRKLPSWGRIHIDRQLPFLCVYRKPSGVDDDGVQRFLLGEASYIIASGEKYLHKSLRALIRNIVTRQVRIFGSALIFEIWTSIPERDNNREYGQGLYPTFRVYSNGERSLDPTVEKLEQSLKKINVTGKTSDVEMIRKNKIVPLGLQSLFPADELRGIGAHLLGLEIKPFYRDSRTGENYPVILRALHRSLSRTFKQTFFEFSLTRTYHSPPHYLSLGRRAAVKAVWEVDDQLANVSNAFDLILYVTPVNVDAAFSEFRRLRYSKTPDFKYRPRTIEPALLKRILYKIPIEKIEDPVLALIFREKQDELDRKITMISDRGSPKFLNESLQVYGGVNNELLGTAIEILNRISPRSRNGSKDGYLNSDGIAGFAAADIEYYRRQYPGFGAEYEIRDDVSGLMVSRGRLLIGKNSKISKSRIKAILQHEIGTHLLTYYNGRAQSLKHMYIGFAGYDELQEGLAVLSEYLVGGLSRPRMRTLAARVLAVHRLIDGSSFVDTFRELNIEYSFSRNAAYSITTRVYRGGGFTKDALYLKGLLRLLRHLKKEDDFNTLYAGKFNIHHIPLIKELKWRKILQPLPLYPRYFNEPETQTRLAALKNEIGIFDLLDNNSTAIASRRQEG